MDFALVKASDAVLIVPTGYSWNCFAPLNYSCPYHNYCPNCNSVWMANWKEGKKVLILSLSACPYYLKKELLMWSFFIHYNHIHYEDDNLCCLKANKVSDGSRLLVLIKNHRQLNCGAVALCWPVIASETGDGFVKGTATKLLRSSCHMLPH